MAHNLKWKNPEYLFELNIMNQFNVTPQEPEKSSYPLISNYTSEI